MVGHNGEHTLGGGTVRRVVSWDIMESPMLVERQ